MTSASEVIPTAFPGPARMAPAERPLVFRICHTISRVVASAMVDLKVFGVEHVPRTGGVLLIANHDSYFDPMVNAVHLPRPMSYLAQSGLFKNPVFGWILRKCFAFPVQQGKGDVGAVKETIRLLKEGRMLNIFPEGSRSPDGTLQPLLPGVALVIRRANVPVVPCLIRGAYAAWPRDRVLPSRGRVRVLYGPAVRLDDLDGREIVRRLERELRALQPRLDAICREFDGPDAGARAR